MTNAVTDMGTADAPLRIAIVGCGAIAGTFHLPALRKLHRRNGITLKPVFVDPEPERARQLLHSFGGGSVETDYRRVANKVDGAIITAPPEYHLSIGRDFLQAGVPILCEKPLASSAHEAGELLELSRSSQTPACVNNTRRLFPASQATQHLLRQGVLGELLELHYREGFRFQWPSASGFYFSRDARRGVLADRGAHILDLVCWWLGTKPAVHGSYADSYGGVEGHSMLELEAAGVSVRVECSWLSNLDNRFRVVGERGTIHAGTEEWGAIHLELDGQRPASLRLPSRELEYSDFALPLLTNFVGVIRREEDPLVGAANVLPSLELIDECYDRMVPFEHPWYAGLEVPA